MVFLACDYFDGYKRPINGRSLDIMKGQALVETVIIAPLVVFLLIGVFEVGWQLRAYLILSNANREAARFAVRPGYLRYDEESYQDIVGQAFNAMAGQIEFSGTIIISVIRVDTGLICDPEKRKADTGLDCDCDKAVTMPYSPTLVISPLSAMTMTYTWPPTSAQKTLLNYTRIISEVVVYNRRHNCQLQLKRGKPQIDEQVAVEMWHYQPQLFGFPLISNPLTDPVRQYAHTVFRKIETRE